MNPINFRPSINPTRGPYNSDPEVIREAVDSINEMRREREIEKNFEKRMREEGRLRNWLKELRGAEEELTFKLNEIEEEAKRYEALNVKEGFFSKDFLTYYEKIKKLFDEAKYTSEKIVEKAEYLRGKTDKKHRKFHEKNGSLPTSKANFQEVNDYASKRWEQGQKNLCDFSNLSEKAQIFRSFYNQLCSFEEVYADMRLYLSLIYDKEATSKQRALSYKSLIELEDLKLRPSLEKLKKHASESGCNIDELLKGVEDLKKGCLAVEVFKADKETDEFLSFYLWEEAMDCVKGLSEKNADYKKKLALKVASHQYETGLAVSETLSFLARLTGPSLRKNLLTKNEPSSLSLKVYDNIAEVLFHPLVKEELILHFFVKYADILRKEDLGLRKILTGHGIIDLVARLTLRNLSCIPSYEELSYEELSRNGFFVLNLTSIVKDGYLCVRQFSFVSGSNLVTNAVDILDYQLGFLEIFKYEASCIKAEILISLNQLREAIESYKVLLKITSKIDPDNTDKVRKIILVLQGKLTQQTARG